MKQSAGIIPFRRTSEGAEVLLLRLGGPLWSGKDAWHYAKGELDPGEDHLTAAKREFYEEVGVQVPGGELIDLGIASSGSKDNYLWAIEADIDLSVFPSTLESNVFSMEWPRRSGVIQQFSENDEAAWFELSAAYAKVFPYLRVTLERLAKYLSLPKPELPEQQSLL